MKAIPTDVTLISSLTVPQQEYILANINSFETFSFNCEEFGAHHCSDISKCANLVPGAQPCTLGTNDLPIRGYTGMYVLTSDIP